MDGKVLGTLEFDKIRQRLAGLTAFSAGRALALSIAPSTAYDDVVARQRLTAEARRLLGMQPNATITGAFDLRSLADKAAIAGLLDTSELLQVESTLSTARRLKGTLGRLAGHLPRLAALSRDIADLPLLIAEIKRSINDKAEVTDDATPALAEIRREARLAHDRLLQRLNGLLQSTNGREVLQEPLYTQRDGRYVLPVKADFRNRMPGIVHDVSSSGATLWVEPLAVVDLGNRWRELLAEEQHEIERVLRRLSALVGEEAERITLTIEVLGRIDLHMASARLGHALGA
ncbi:MAG: endonuclease MutS2, partial [Dehalococcoidia bacterium]|nr:endonuclease MutS2 [Dehalococcoidia bacterium]